MLIKCPEFITLLIVICFVSCNSQTVECNNKNDIIEEVRKSFNAKKINNEIVISSKSPAFIDHYNYNTDGNISVYKGYSIIEYSEIKTFIEYQYNDNRLTKEIKSKYYDDVLIEELSETLTIVEYDINNKPILIKSEDGLINKVYTYKDCLESSETIHDIKKEKVIKFKELKYDENSNLINLNTTFEYEEKIIEEMFFVNYEYNANRDWIFRAIILSDDTYLIEKREITYK